jgi:uncharacterized protein
MEKQDHKTYQVKLWDTEDLPFTIDHPEPVRVVRSEEVLERNRFVKASGSRTRPTTSGCGSLRSRSPSSPPPPFGSSVTAVLSEAFHLLGERGAPGLSALLLRRAVVASFSLDNSLGAVLRLLQKYANVPMSLADACLVRMSETVPDPVILTTDSNFRIYRRHSRQVIPCILPR